MGVNLVMFGWQLVAKESPLTVGVGFAGLDVHDVSVRWAVLPVEILSVVAGLLTEPLVLTGTVSVFSLLPLEAFETCGRNSCEVRRPSHNSQCRTRMSNLHVSRDKRSSADIP